MCGGFKSFLTKLNPISVPVAISVQFAVNRIASRSGVVAMSLQAPRSGQPATFFPLAELARANPAAGGMAMLAPTMVSSGILPNPPASGQVRPVWAPDVGCPNVEKVGFFLLLIEQAENANFVRENNIGLIVTVLGPGSQKPKYPTGVKHVDFLVTYAGGRKEQLKVALPLIVAAFSQGLNVAVHCLSSFHRAPPSVVHSSSGMPR